MSSFSHYLINNDPQYALCQIVQIQILCKILRYCINQIKQEMLRRICIELIIPNFTVMLNLFIHWNPKPEIFTIPGID